MRTVQFLADFGGHAAGDHVEVDDQMACDAIAQGAAVPRIDPISKAINSAPENKALDPAVEVK